jgi:HptB-dependent secretion and biofilm anti anti-sigma factor
MALEVEKSADEIRIKPSGEFDSAVQKEFRDAYKNEAPGRRYVVDMVRVTFISSAALGILLLLREHAGGDKSDITIVNTSPVIRKLLEVTRFGEIFKIS